MSSELDSIKKLIKIQDNLPTTTTKATTTTSTTATPTTSTTTKFKKSCDDIDDVVSGHIFEM